MNPYFIGFKPRIYFNVSNLEGNVLLPKEPWEPTETEKAIRDLIESRGNDADYFAELLRQYSEMVPQYEHMAESYREFIEKYRDFSGDDRYIRLD